MTIDPFDDARDSFVKLDDVNGRLLLITSLSTGERPSTLPGQQGKMYDWVETTTVVLDGEITDLIETVPLVLDGFQFSGANIMRLLKPKIRTRRMTLGRLGKKPSQTRGFGDAWSLRPGTDADKDLAKRWIAAHPAPAEPDPFSSPAY
jgi:hypothetical protein